MIRSTPDNLAKAPAFINRQVRASYHYYLNLSPGRCRDVVVVCGGLEYCRADYLIDRSELPFLVVEFVVGGQGWVTLGGVTHDLRAGTAYTYFPRTRHVIHTDPGAPLAKYYVAMVGDAAEELVRKSPLGSKGIVQVGRPEEVVALLDLMSQYAAQQTPYSPELCAALVPVLVLKIAEAVVPHDVDAKAYASYRAARDLIRARFLDFSTLEEVAVECGVSVHHLCRLFRRFDRETGYQFLVRTKMNHAAELLSEPGSLVRSVAERVGYVDPFQFSRVFKRVHKVSPVHFKRMRS